MEDEILIECVRKYTFIYDVTDKGHADMRLLKNTWEEIAKTVGSSGKYNLFSLNIEHFNILLYSLNAVRLKKNKIVYTLTKIIILLDLFNNYYVLP